MEGNKSEKDLFEGDINILQEYRSAYEKNVKFVIGQIAVHGEEMVEILESIHGNEINEEALKELGSLIQKMFEILEQNVEERLTTQSFPERVYSAELQRKMNNQEKNQEDFLRMCRHDLRNYLALLYSVVQILKRNINLLDDLHKGVIREFPNFLKRLLILTKEPKPEFHALAEMGEEESACLNTKAEDKNVTLSFSNTEEEVFTDINYLNVILDNLVGNALKFVPNDGTGKVDIIAEKGKKGFLYVQVIDNGSGMSLEKAEIINNMFHQGFTTRGRIESELGTNQEPGTGKGLIICTRYAEKIGVALSVESGEEGTVFTLKIPATVEDFLGSNMVNISFDEPDVLEEGIKGVSEQVNNII